MTLDEILVHRVRSVMKSMVYVSPDGARSEKALQEWVHRAVAYASSLPAKGGKGA